MSEEQGRQWLIDHAQDVFELLKSIREEIFHCYQVRLLFDIPLDVNKDSRWCEKYKFMTKDSSRS